LLEQKERKINQFELWLEAFNKAYNMDIRYIHNKNNPTLDKAWLAGYSDAEGCFSVSVVKRSESYNQVFVRFFLSPFVLTKCNILYDQKSKRRTGTYD
jgi:hypothetical protein